ncbi:MAG TPA: FecR domain-containing protein, partial [Verrucomicrobiae bacterium]|nr:FecR domain-containing protein [Verrucomicrobiae bacterium]
MSVPYGQMKERTPFVGEVPSYFRPRRNPVLIGLVAVCVLCLRLQGAEGDPDAILTNHTGSVEYKPRDQPKPIPAVDQQQLFPHDLIRTLEDSSAVVWVRRNDCSVKLRELSSLEILPPEGNSGPWLNLLQGALYFFSREKTHEVQIRTPHATGAPRGTEFVVTVDADRTELAVLNGTATLMNESGKLELQSGEVGVARDGQPPIKLRLEATNLVQWWLYYPGVLDVDELSFTAAEKTELGASLEAYRLGDLASALTNFPGYPSPLEPKTDSARGYLAALWLASGEVGKTEALLGKIAPDSPAATALRWVIAAVQQKVDKAPQVHTSASEWLGLSYYYQARHELEKALDAANRSVTISTNFAFGWERVAELEFGFGRIQEAKAALDKSLRLAPRNAQAHALKGFLFSAENHIKKARAEFEEAIHLDPNLGNAWLGRGLVRIRTGDASGGRMDLKMAAILEPNRSLLRSYLGKAFADAHEDKMAAAELKRAEELDPNDPTPWLYSALLQRDQNDINGAVSNLQKAIELNDNRAVYRSRLLLDQDRAVTGVNLASIYRDAGMSDVSVREAASAVNDDYANASAHLFLSDAYNDLRDPTQFNLRYETVWFNELLLANLLSPVGGGRLSQEISQQEYSKLFQQDGLSLASSTDVRSDGMYHEQASQFGTFGNTAYALDLDYHHNAGIRVNNGLDDIEWNTTIKQQVTPQDTALLLVQYQDYHSGDNFQYYDQANARPFYKFDEYQHPILVGGWDHEWSPGIRTLVLLGRLTDEQYFSDKAAPQLLLWESPPGTVGLVTPTAYDISYHNSFDIYSAELNQICEWDRVTLSAGARYQTGRFQTQDLLNNPLVGGLTLATVADSTSENFERITGYGYLTVEPLKHLWLTGGFAYDQVTFPENYRSPPVFSGEAERSQLGPKAALVWNPIPQATLRGVYTRSLGGVSLDESYRLEPTQLAGFPQAFRSLISESLVGSVSAPSYETLGVALDLKLGPRTFAGIEAQQLKSGVSRNIGVFSLINFLAPGGPDATGEQLDYQERTLSVSLNQLVGDRFVLGTSYSITRSELHDVLTDIPVSVFAAADQTERSTLQQVEGYIQFNHPSGFFARAEVHWYGQSNSG